MAGDFVSADIDRIDQFKAKSQEAITEFNAIKTEFGEINTTLLAAWEGEGAEEYQLKADHILERIGNIQCVLDEINNGIVADIRDSYNKLDDELGQFNATLGSEE